jgi:7,8-dihydropterin-6-yl-methyl-4-(beta-D-ribofuranosyl)aminobenzene 5'-phosphate synthase
MSVVRPGARGIGLTMVAGTAAALARRYAAGREHADRQTVAELDTRLTDLGEVDRLSILPLVERHTRDGGLRGEPGVSYLIRADDLTVLFDTGLGTGEERTVLESNADSLGVAFDDLDCVAISHLHADHVGGARSQLAHSFSLGREHRVPRALTAYVPTEMTHPRADLCVVDQTTVIGPGVALLPPLPRMLFWLGPIAEQALVVNVRGRGLVLVTGCGHPEIERTLAAAEKVVQASVHAVIGGLHLPVHPLGTPLVPQAVLGNPNWPWRPISEADAFAVISTIQERGPGLVALSGHDSTPWTIEAFGQAFGDRYRTVRVGEEIVIAAPGADASVHSAT